MESLPTQPVQYPRKIHKLKFLASWDFNCISLMKNGEFLDHDMSVLFNVAFNFIKINPVDL